MTTDRQVGFLTKEVLIVVSLALLIDWYGFFRQRGYAKQLPCPFRITRRDDGCVQVVEPLLVEELMNRKRCSVSDAHHRGHGVGSHAKVRLLAKEFHGVHFRLQRVIICRGVTQNRQICDMQLHGLAGAHAFNQLAINTKASTCCDALK